MRHSITSRVKGWFVSVFPDLSSFVHQLTNAPQPTYRSQLSNAEYHLSQEEIRRLIASAASIRDQLLIQLMAETGLRRSEIVELRWSDFDPKRRLLRIQHGKGNKMRLVPISSSFIRSLLATAPTLADVPIFVSRLGRSLSLRQVNRIVAQAGVRAGLCNPNPKHAVITCHLLRHSFARHWKAVGGSIETLSKILGHSSVKTTWDQYGTEGLDDIIASYNKTITLMQRHR